MNKQELREEYENGQLDRPARLRQLREEIKEHADLRVPRRIGEIREWWDNNKAVVSRRLNEDEESETDETDDSDSDGDNE